MNNSGMRNSAGLYNDGLTDTCKNNGQVWGDLVLDRLQLI